MFTHLGHANKQVINLGITFPGVSVALPLVIGTRAF